MKKLLLALVLTSALAAPAFAQFVPTPSPASNTTPTIANPGQTAANPGFQTAAPVPLTATSCNATQVTTGGTAVTLLTAGQAIHGAMIQNPKAASEDLFISLAGAAVTSVSAGGSSYDLIAGEKFYIPGPMVGTVSVNAVTSAHFFNCSRW